MNFYFSSQRDIKAARTVNPVKRFSIFTSATTLAFAKFLHKFQFIIISVPCVSLSQSSDHSLSCTSATGHHCKLYHNNANYIYINMHLLNYLLLFNFLANMFFYKLLRLSASLLHPCSCLTVSEVSLGCSLWKMILLDRIWFKSEVWRCWKAVWDHSGICGSPYWSEFNHFPVTPMYLSLN